MNEESLSLSVGTGSPESTVNQELNPSGGMKADVNDWLTVISGVNPELAARLDAIKRLLISDVCLSASHGLAKWIAGFTGRVLVNGYLAVAAARDGLVRSGDKDVDIHLSTSETYLSTSSTMRAVLDEMTESLLGGTRFYGLIEMPIAPSSFSLVKRNSSFLLLQVYTKEGVKAVYSDPANAGSVSAEEISRVLQTTPLVLRHWVSRLGREVYEQKLQYTRNYFQGKRVSGDEFDAFKKALVPEAYLSRIPVLILVNDGSYSKEYPRQRKPLKVSEFESWAFKEWGVKL